LGSQAAEAGRFRVTIPIQQADLFAPAFASFGSLRRPAILRCRKKVISVGGSVVLLVWLLPSKARPRPRLVQLLCVVACGQAVTCGDCFYTGSSTHSIRFSSKHRLSPCSVKGTNSIERFRGIEGIHQGMFESRNSFYVAPHRSSLPINDDPVNEFPDTMPFLKLRQRFKRGLKLK
jgi:hypothetical protein